MNGDLNTIFLQSLGWALAHSIWQLTVLALMLAFVLPRLHNARKRYWCAFMTLLVGFGAFAGTFIWTASSKISQGPGTFSDTSFQIAFGMHGRLPVSTAGITDGLSNWLEIHAFWVVILWAAGFSISLFRLFGGMFYLYRLKRIKVKPAPEFWQDKLNEMCKQLGLVRPVAFLESALVHSPLAWGYFKPLIFFPIGLVNHLSTAEVESILAHELAHIARRDWLFNLIQAFIEAMFYYHPAAWWIASLVSAERENCCDDTAVELTGNRFILAKALMHLQQLNAPHPAPILSLGAQGRRKIFHRFSLLSRIRRILNQPSQQKSLIMEKFAATALLLGILALVGMRANGNTRLEAANKVLSETAFAWFGGQPDEQSTLDSVPKPPRQIEKIIQEDNGKRVEMDLNDGQIMRLNINGQDIPSTEWAQHQALTKDVLRDMELHSIPAPPAPPSMPSMPAMPAPPGMPAMPPMPPMPANEEGFNMRFKYPMSAIAPAAPHRVSTSKDADGNTIIHLERAGKPVDITVKNGEVWVDGQQVEDGKSLELPESADAHEWITWNGDHGNFGFQSGDMTFYTNDDGALIPSPEALRQLQMDGAQLEHTWNVSEKEQKKQEKDMLKAEKDMRKAQVEMEKQQRKMEESLRKMHEQDASRRKQYQERRSPQ